MRSLAILLASAALLSIGAVRQDDPTYTLTWKPTEGQTIEYGFSAKVKGGEAEVEFQTDLHLKIAKVETDGGYTLETRRDHVKVITDGQEHDVPDEDQDKVETEKFNAHGDKISPDADDKDDDPDEMTALLRTTTDFDSPEKPVMKGDKWSKEVKADPAKKIKAGKLDYEVLGVGKIDKYDVVNVSVKYKQTEGDHPASFEGTLAFDMKDMSPVSIEASVKDAPLDEENLGEVKVKLTRK